MRRNALTLPGIPTHLSSWKSEPCLLDLINPTASRPPSPIDSATWSIYSQRPPANPITKKFNNLKSKFDSIVRPQNDYYDKRSGPISKTLSYLRNKMDTALSTSQLYPTKDEVRQWETSFEALLNNKQGCALFRQFLKKEFSDENVDFWCACEEFKNIKDPKKLKQKAHEIYKEFVAEQAPKEVNLDSDTRAATKAAIFEEVVKLDTFSLAQSRIEQLMAKDSYRRFLKDRIYLDMLEGFENGTNSNTGSTANLANGNNSPK